MPARKHDDWALLVNTPVEIRREGEVLRVGVVEDAMPDSSALWIAAEGALPRQMFEASLGHEVWFTPQELTGNARYKLTAARVFERAQCRLKKPSAAPPADCSTASVARASQPERDNDGLSAGTAKQP